MSIKMIYAPYNLVRWAQMQNMLPKDAKLICATLLPEIADTAEDGLVKIALSENFNSSKQFTQVLVCIAYYVAQTTGQKLDLLISSIAEQFAAEWLMSDLVHTDTEYMQNISGIFRDSIVHPVSLALDILNQMGVIGGDPLIYIGSDNMVHGDFIFSGQNTQEQITCMFAVLKPIFGEDKIQLMLSQLQQQWQQQINYFGVQHGFRLNNYDFAILSSLSR